MTSSIYLRLYKHSRYGGGSPKEGKGKEEKMKYNNVLTNCIASRLWRHKFIDRAVDKIDTDWLMARSVCDMIQFDR